MTHDPVPAHPHRLFLYGTLQHPPLCRRLLGRIPAMTEAVAPGYRAAPVLGRVYPGLVPDAGSSAAGAVVWVSSDELAILDEFEGTTYRRTEIPVMVGDERVSAGAWLRLDTDSGESGTWSLEVFVVHDAAAFLAASTAGEVHPDAR